MQTSTEIQTIFTCSLERAFKSPMLCDITRVHSGYFLLPKVTHCLDDADWGKPGGSRRMFMERSITFRGGEAALDTVLERKENVYWKIEINRFTFWMGGFKSFIGEWSTRQLAPDKIQILYRYTLVSDSKLLYPFHWIFTKTYWRLYMYHVLENVKELAYSNAPYLHD